MARAKPLPKRPFRSFEDFLENHWRRRYSGPREKDLPCHRCHGSGRVYRFEDRDVIEGYKLAPTYSCGDCGGSGRTTRADVKAFYDIAIVLWREDRDEEVRRRAALKKAQALLTPDEMELLGL